MEGVFRLEGKAYFKKKVSLEKKGTKKEKTKRGEHWKRKSITQEKRPFSGKTQQKSDKKKRGSAEKK